MSDISANLNVPFESEIGKSSLGSKWLFMTQKTIPESEQSAGVYDALQMLQMGMSGLTSHKYTAPAGISFSGDQILISLDFYVWPSSPELAYSISINQGTLSPRKAITLQKVRNIVVPMSDCVALEYEGTTNSLEWDTPCYDSKGAIVPAPSYEIREGCIILDKTVFGVLRADMNASGFQYTATLSFPKTASSREEIRGIHYNQVNVNSITNVKCTVKCLYTDSNGNEKIVLLELILPKNVTDFLEECPDNSLIVDNCTSEETTHITIYYSTCDGEVLQTIRATSSPCDKE